MFWLRCNKILVRAGGVLNGPNCPCPSYIYVTLCNATEHGYDNCECNQEEAARRALLVPFHENGTGGCIEVNGAVRRLDQKYTSADGPEFSQFGSRYKAIESGAGGMKKYSTSAEADAFWATKPLSYWGMLVIGACNCCCTFSARLDVKITLKDDYTWIGTNWETGEQEYEQKYGFDIESRGTVSAVSSIAIPNTSGTAYSYNWYTYCDIPERKDGNCWDEECSGSTDEIPFSVHFERSADCTEWEVASFSPVKPYLVRNSDGEYQSECGWGTAQYYPVLKWTKSSRTGNYLTGTWTGTYYHDHWDPDHNTTHTINATIEISLSSDENFPVPSSYKGVYDDLSEKLKKQS